MSGSSGSSSRYFKLGIFMLIGVGLLAAGVITLGAGSLFQHKIPIETLVYDSVNGLDVGSAVKYRGVPIGQVTGIIFASAKYPEAANTPASPSAGRNIRGILIEMELTERAFPGENESQIREVAKQLLDEGLRARVTPAGISGQSFIELDLLDKNEFPPPLMNWKPDVLFVPSAPSPLNQVFDAAGEIASQLQKANLGQVVHHIDELATQATAAVTNVNRTIDANRDNLNRTIAQLPDTAARLRATAARADQILHDPRVDKAIGNISGLSDSATATIGDIHRLVRETEGLLSGESNDIRSTLADLRHLMADAAALGDDAKQNPSRILFGRPPEKNN